MLRLLAVFAHHDNELSFETLGQTKTRETVNHAATHQPRELWRSNHEIHEIHETLIQINLVRPSIGFRVFRVFRGHKNKRLADGPSALRFDLVFFNPRSTTFARATYS